MRRLAVLVVCLATTGAALAGQDPDADRISVELLLGRAAWYVQDFLEKFSNVVSEETYIQDSGVPMQTAAAAGRAGTAVRSRILKSDFLMVAASSAQDLVAFRDVFEVDTHPVRDREQRLTNLFLKPSEDSVKQATRIQDEGARYNLGNMRRTVNNPVLGLVVVQADFHDRFRYTLGKEDPRVGPGVWIVDYQEVARPAIVRGPSDIDVFAHGRVWIKAETGRIMKTELLLDQPKLRAKITSSFRFDERFDIAVPFEMREEYQFDSGTRVTAVATYDRFRRFDVSTDETLN